MMAPRDKEAKDFVAEYEKITGKKLKPDYLDCLCDVDSMPKDWRLVELLASVGNPLSFDMPSVLDNDPTPDMSFAGVRTYGANLFYVPNDPLSGISEMRARRPRR